MDRQFSSNKPYLFRAIYDWLLDNGATPYLLVDASQAGVDVPVEHVKDGQIVLNIDPNAVHHFVADNEAVSFSARFSGTARQIYVPMNAILAIYAQENGLGMAFPAVETEPGTSQNDVEPRSKEGDKPDEKKSSHLKIVK